MQRHPLFFRTLIGLVMFGLVLGFHSAQAGQRQLGFEVKEFFLDNGMQFLIVERPDVPQVACRVAIRAGSALEENGKTGIAHMLEHMLFKGTKNFGTLNQSEDEALRSRIEAIYQDILKEQQKRNPDQGRLQSKRDQMAKLRAKARKIYVPQVFSSQLGSNGAVGINAFTTKDQTQYYMAVPSDMLEQWFSIVSEQLFEPAWREFYVEKEVVQREWAFRYVNNANGAAWLDLNNTFYTAHPYRNPVIGWPSDMARFNATDARAFHAEHYHPANTVVVLVGDITQKDAYRFANIYFARYPGGSRATEVVTDEPVPAGPRRSVRYLKGARTPILRMAFPGARMGTPDFYALDALTMVLSHGRSARLILNIVNQGKALNAWAYNPDNRYGGQVIMGGSPLDPPQLTTGELTIADRRKAYLAACEQLENRLLAELDTLRQEPVALRELERIKKLNERDFIDRMRNNEDLAATLATLEIQTGWRYLTTYLKHIAAVTPEDIQRVARQYLQPAKRTTAIVIPGGRPDQPVTPYQEVRTVAGRAASGLPKPASFENVSRYPTPPQWRHPLSFTRTPNKIDYPQAEAFTIKGTQVFYLPDRQLPLISLKILVKAGRVDLAEDKTGLDTLLNLALVRGGTQTYPPEELARVLDENAIGLTIQTGEEDTLIELSVLKEDWSRGLEILRKVLLKPRFDDQVLATSKKQVVMALQRQGGDAQTVAMREATIWHFKDHPYGRDPLAALNTIERLKKQDLKAFLSTYFTPANMTIAVAGDIDLKSLRADLNTFLKKWPTKRPAQRRLQDPVPNQPVLALIHKPGQVQSQIILRLTGIKRTDPDYWKLNLLTSIFGGNDSLLYKRLRDDLGLVYSAGFYQTYKWQAGQLVGYIGCKGDQTAAAIHETVAIMRGLRNGVPSEELELKRRDALNSFVFNVDTAFDLVEVYARYHMRKEPLNTLDKIQDAYMTATPQDMERLAARLLRPDQLQIFVVADKDIKITPKDGERHRLADELQATAAALGLNFHIIPLR